MAPRRGGREGSKRGCSCYCCRRDTDANTAFDLEIVEIGKRGSDVVVDSENGSGGVTFNLCYRGSGE